MKQILFSTVIAITCLSQVKSYSNSLSDCKTIAKLFWNTCTQAPDSAATWYTNFATSYVSCTYMSACPGGYGSPYNCNWPRKLCVSCSTNSTDSQVYMRIQTNTLPSHCSVTKGTPPEWVLDWSIKWNPDVSSSSNVTFASQSAFDNWVCAMEKTNAVPTTSVFSNLNTTGYSSTNDVITTGIAMNGVPIFSSVSGDLVDPYYPQMWSGVKKSTVSSEDVDACLGHAGGGVYHYHNMLNCVANRALDTSNNCTATTDCNSDLKSYALSAFSSNKSISVFGVAKDGHLIIGPYDASGNLFDCSGLDACSGTWLDDGSYVYVLTEYFPYTLNCFGPAQANTYNASCSANPCIPGYSSGNVLLHYILGTFLIALTASLF